MIHARIVADPRFLTVFLCAAIPYWSGVVGDDRSWRRSRRDIRPPRPRINKLFTFFFFLEHSKLRVAELKVFLYGLLSPFLCLTDLWFQCLYGRKKAVSVSGLVTAGGRGLCKVLQERGHAGVSLGRCL